MSYSDEINYSIPSEEKTDEEIEQEWEEKYNREYVPDED